MDKEDLLHFGTEAAAQFPGRRPSRATMWRWYLRGCKGVKLETILIGGQRYTSKAAIERFIQDQNQPKDQPAELAPISATQRARQNTAARQALAAIGI